MRQLPRQLRHRFQIQRNQTSGSPGHLSVITVAVATVPCWKIIALVVGSGSPRDTADKSFLAIFCLESVFKILFLQSHNFVR